MRSIFLGGALLREAFRNRQLGRFVEQFLADFGGCDFPKSYTLEVTPEGANIKTKLGRAWFTFSKGFSSAGLLSVDAIQNRYKRFCMEQNRVR